MTMPLDIIVEVEGERIKKVKVDEGCGKISILGSQKLTAGLLKWFEEYAKGKEIPVRFQFDLERLTPFTQKVLLEIAKIPFGKTMSYKELAACLGNPQASRAVGGACARNPFPLLIPCHRVIASNGALTGFSAGSGIDLKNWLLDREQGL